jgi:hypothetical protein
VLDERTLLNQTLHVSESEILETEKEIAAGGVLPQENLGRGTTVLRAGAAYGEVLGLFGSVGDLIRSHLTVQTVKVFVETAIAGPAHHRPDQCPLTDYR